MSTTPVTPVTPVPAAEVNVNMPKEQIAAAVPAPAIPAIPVAVEPTPENPVVTKDLGNGQFEVKYLTGETFKGTAAEILPKIGGAHVSTKLWAKTEIEKAKQPATPVQNPPPTSRFISPEEEATAGYVADLFAKKMGYDNAEQMLQDQGRIKQNTEAFAGQNLSVQFAAIAPEFNATKENSEKLLNTVEQLGLAENMASGDPTKQLNALRAAHAFALQTKVYEPKPTAAAPTPQIPPPPIPTAGPTDLNAVPEDLRVNVNMTKEEIQRRIDLAKSRNYIY